MPLPRYGFDPSEVAIVWKLLSQAGWNVIFSTPNGKKAQADTLMLTGRKLGIFKPLLQARKDAIAAYKLLQEDNNFCHPLTYNEIHEEDYCAIYLAGGHDKGVKEYLESLILQNLIAQFFNKNKPVGAVCHGVILVARSIDKRTNQSVIHQYKTTALLKSQEQSAYKLTKLWLKDYYLTYPETTVEDEVKSFLVDQAHFVKGPVPLLRDSLKKLNRGFCLQDRNYLSARWPGDIYTFSKQFIKLISHH